MPITKFFRVAASGKTVDGRDITPAQIDQMAEAYNPATYTARVNLEHLRSLWPGGDFKAYGDVLACRSTPGPDGKRFLEVQVDATADLVKLAADRQKTFWSVEIHPSFADTGKAYLMGLAATDSPASLHTEVMKFTLSSDKTPADIRARLFSVGSEAPLTLDTDPPPADDKPGLFARVKELLAGSKAGDDKRFAQVETALTEIAKEVGELKTASGAAKPDGELAETVNKLSAELKALTTTLETTSPATFRNASSGGGGGATTDC